MALPLFTLEESTCFFRRWKRAFVYKTSQEVRARAPSPRQDRIGTKNYNATNVGAHTSELILTWVLAIQQNLKIGAAANLIAPYPTLSEVSKRVAGSYYTPTLFSQRTSKLVGALQHLPQ